MFSYIINGKQENSEPEKTKQKEFWTWVKLKAKLIPNIPLMDVSFTYSSRQIIIIGNTENKIKELLYKVIDVVFMIIEIPFGL